jgi:hypothetical protein
MLHVNALCTRYRGNFANNSFIGENQQIDLQLDEKCGLSSHAASAIQDLGRSQVEPEPTIFGVRPDDNIFLPRTVRYLGATKAGGVPHGRGSIFFRAMGFSSQNNWTTVSGEWEDGILVQPDATQKFKVVTGRNLKTSKTHFLPISQWNGARSALVGHRDVNVEVGDYAWNGAQLRRLDGQPMPQEGDPTARALGHALEALHVFEDLIRADATAEFVDAIEFQPLHEGPIAELREAGVWEKFSPAAIQRLRAADKK